MRIKTLLLALFALCLSSVLLISADYQFNVMASKGDVQIFAKSSKSWSKLNTGAKIQSNEKIKIGNNSYLGLVHKSGKTIELKQSGEFTTEQPATKTNTSKSSVAQKLGNYIVNQLNDTKSQSDYREGMETTGAVERSMDKMTADPANATIELNSPRKICLKSNNVNLSWKEVPKAKSYKLFIRDRFDREVYSSEVKNSNVNLDANALKLEKDTFYFWHVALSNDANVKSPDCTFSVLSNSQIDKITSDVAELKKELGDDTSALNKIVIGNYYEMNNLYEDANKLYKDASEANPEVSEYKEIYNRFLKRMNSAQ